MNITEKHLNSIINYKYSKFVYTRNIYKYLVIYDVRDKKFRILNDVAKVIYNSIEIEDTFQNLLLKISN